MTLDQIKKFVFESKEQSREWDLIAIMGGEPTLHPQFFQILDVLISFKTAYSPKTILEVKSNGYGSKVQAILAKIPSDVYIGSTDKKGPVQESFGSFNIAPVDLPAYTNADYTNACNIPMIFGIGLTRSGYYPCAVAGSIDRVLGFNKGRKIMPQTNDAMQDQLLLFCKYCGHFKRFNSKGKGEEMSIVWKHAYKSYESNKPVLSVYK